MISTRGLAFRHAGGPLLSFGDVDVAQGGVLLLRGPSGSGKSTWLSLAAALLPPSAGEITVGGRSLGSLGPVGGDAWRAAAIGFLPQKLHLSAALTVHGNLALAQWAAGRTQDDRQIADALRALGVQDLAHRKPAQLSGGQAQRVALARAVLLKPQVILADEPTASLDDEAAEAALALLISAAQIEGLQGLVVRRATLVIATHDSRVAARLEEAAGPAGVQQLNLPRPRLA